MMALNKRGDGGSKITWLPPTLISTTLCSMGLLMKTLCVE